MKTEELRDEERMTLTVIYVTDIVICVCDRYYIGLRPTLLVNDPEIIKLIEVKNFQSAPNRSNLLELRDAPPKPGEPDDSIITYRGDRWKKIRSILSPSFTINKMKLMAPVITNCINDLMSNLAAVKEQNDIEIYDLYKRLTMDVIGRTAFGIQTHVQKNPKNDLFLRYAQGVISRFPLFDQLFILTGTGIYYGTDYWPNFRINKEELWMKGEWYRVSFPEAQWLMTPLFETVFKLANRGKNPRVGLNEECTKVIHARKKDPKAKRLDLLQLMLDTEMTEEQMNNATLTAGEDDDKETDTKSDVLANGSSKDVKRLSEDEMKANASLFLLAGYETTSTALAFTTYLLVKHQDVQERVRQEILEIVEANGDISYTSVQKLKYLDAVCNEALRLYPPVHLFVTREATEDIPCGKFTVPKGVAIQIPAYTLQRDPDYWQDPDTFNPDRFVSHFTSTPRPTIPVILLSIFHHLSSIKCICENVEFKLYLKYFKESSTHATGPSHTLPQLHVLRYLFLPENKNSINPFAFQSFGAGPRNCIGMRFAQMELKMALSTILLKYKLLPGKSFEQSTPYHIGNNVFRQITKVKQYRIRKSQRPANLLVGYSLPHADDG
ncbi:TBXAS1 [Cordylochernes scorpioides]|uniref:TBXAS1 n=1 Tax=Cordylochernes scorpioides TaxID=51811 RepID=A0ABY6K2Z5_9ARAC|nr:TBXAS1 [Cordylochernes scorpioides]